MTTAAPHHARHKGKHPAKAPRPRTQAKAPPPPCQPQKQVSQPVQGCPLLAEKPCDVDKLTLKVESLGEEEGTKKLEAVKIRRQDAVSGVKSKAVLALLARYDLIIDVVAGYPSREDSFPKSRVKIEAEAEYHGRKCATQTHPLMRMVAGTGALELPPAGIVVKEAKIGPKEFHAAPINADFGVEGGGLGVIWCILRSIWPTADPKLIELRAESCGIRARGDGGQQRRNLLGLVRIYRKDTFTVAIKLPPLGSYTHEREGTVTGERESSKSSEYSAGFGYAKGKSSSTTGADGNYEHTGETWRGGKGDAYGLSQKTEDNKTTRTFTEQHTGNDGGLTLGKPSSAPHTPGAEGRKITGEDGHFDSEVMKELEKQGPIALVIKRNDREFEKELLGPHKSLKQMIIDGLVKGVETIARAIETFNKLPQVGWKFEFSLSFFAGTIGLEWSPKALPGPIADGRYYPVGLRVVGKIAMDIIALEASLSFGVDVRALGTGIVAKVEGKAGLKVAVETEIKLEEWKPKVEVGLKPEASFKGIATGYASVAGYSLIDAKLTCGVAITMDDGKLELSAEHGIKLKGTLRREAIELKGYIKVPVWGLKRIDPPVVLCEGAVLHKFD